MIEQAFEARFEKGYRYLDRCGDAMLILEDLLTNEIGRVWMPEDMQPSGARIKCPEAEISVSFDTTRLAVSQSPVEFEEEFADVCVMACAAVLPRFGITDFVRVGARRKYLFGTDSIEQAEALSVKTSPNEIWPSQLPQGFGKTLCTRVIEMARPDRSSGIKVSVGPIFKAGAELTVDPRLRIPPHLLGTKQREALLAQIARRRKRREDPDAGLLLDVDYYLTRPSTPDFKAFLGSAWAEIGSQVNIFRKGSGL